MPTHSLEILTSTTVPQVFREKTILTWVPLDTPRQEVLVRKSSRPPTRPLGIFTSMVLDLHDTGTVAEEVMVRTRNQVLGEGKRNLEVPSPANTLSLGSNLKEL